VLAKLTASCAAADLLSIVNNISKQMYKFALWGLLRGFPKGERQHPDVYSFSQAVDDFF
jgi:hypothetical protein